jgi:glycosyltransferase involved in cell wall biosynthesis
MNDPELSIVVIGRNEGDRLACCLQTLTLPGLQTELIYVDSGSTDRSVAVARSFGAKVLVLAGGLQTAARARNAGLRRARAPYVLFLDGDTILRPAFPRAALHAMESDRNIASVWGHRRETHTEHSVYNRVLDLDWIYAPGPSEYCGGDVLMRRSALTEVGEFDASLIAGEEPELCRRLRAQGYRIEHIDVPMTGHDLDITRWGQYWRRAVRAGYAYAEVSSRYRDSDDPMWLQESRRNIGRAGCWISWLLLVAGTAVLKGWWAVPLLALLPILMIRTAWKCRWKAPGQITLLLLYSFHSHFQQIPILAGQVRYLFRHSAHQQRQGMEYKRGANV